MTNNIDVNINKEKMERLINEVTETIDCILIGYIYNHVHVALEGILQSLCLNAHGYHESIYIWAFKWDHYFKMLDKFEHTENFFNDVYNILEKDMDEVGTSLIGGLFSLIAWATNMAPKELAKAEISNLFDSPRMFVETARLFLEIIKKDYYYNENLQKIVNTLSIGYGVK